MSRVDVDPAELAEWELKYAVAVDVLRRYTAQARLFLDEEGGSPALATFKITRTMIREELEAGYLATCLAVALAILCGLDFDRMT